MRPNFPGTDVPVSGATLRVPQNSIGLIASAFWKPSFMMLRPLYDRATEFAKGRNALWTLAGVSFLESSIFPVPPDALMVPMAVAAPRRAFLLASVTLAASVIGGLFGYMIGALMYEQVGLQVLEFFNAQTHSEAFFGYYNRYGAWCVFIAGFTPIPYKAVTILSGAAALPVLEFTIASIAGRGARFFLLAWLVWRFGDSARRFLEGRLALCSWMLLCLVALLLLLAWI